VVTVHRGFAEITPEWDELALRSNASPFARPGWLDPWWEAFGEGELAILVLREQGTMRGVLPLERRDGVFHALANSHTPLFEPVVEDPEAAAQLMLAATELSGRRVELTEVDADGPVTSALTQAADRSGGRVRVRSLRESPYAQLDGDFDAYRASLSKGRRRETDRRRRRLDELGRITIEWADGREGLRERLAEGYELEASEWKREAGTAITSSTVTARFYSEVARWAARAGMLRLAFLRLEGRAIAFKYTLWTPRACYSLKSGFDSDFRSASPLTVLLHELVARACAKGVRRVELLGDADPHKLDWTNGVHQIVRAQVFAPTLSGSADWVGQSYGRPLAKRLAAALSV
jgi:CelD/BcsL family acetyltransferase involved in cellulose biosynthesis